MSKNSLTSYPGALEAQAGNLEKACATWNQALDAMDGVRSGRTPRPRLTCGWRCRRSDARGSPPSPGLTHEPPSTSRQ